MVLLTLGGYLKARSLPFMYLPSRADGPANWASSRVDCARFSGVNVNANVNGIVNRVRAA